MPSDPVTLDDWRFCKVHGSARDYEDVDDPTCDASREWSDPCEWLTHVQILEGMGAKRRNLCREHHARYNDGAPGCEVWMAAKEGGASPTPCEVEPFLLMSLVLPLPTPKEEK